MRDLPSVTFNKKNACLFIAMAPVGLLLAAFNIWKAIDQGSGMSLIAGVCWGFTGLLFLIFGIVSLGRRAIWTDAGRLWIYKSPVLRSDFPIERITAIRLDGTKLFIEANGEMKKFHAKAYDPDQLAALIEAAGSEEFSEQAAEESSNA